MHISSELNPEFYKKKAIALPLEANDKHELRKIIDQSNEIDYNRITKQ